PRRVGAGAPLRLSARQPRAGDADAAIVFARVKDTA
ncbi:MAG: hypothetical protein JWQ48_248, partial [Conexibacter sp.]|nr:hypothetical protein [Conexibacter sp.]